MELTTYIAESGTTITEFARKLSCKCGKTVSRDVVYQWTKGIRPIPTSYGHPIEEITGGAMTRQAMFPTKWQDIWPELANPSARRATDAAPTAGHAGRQPPTTNNMLDTMPDHAAVVSTGERP